MKTLLFAITASLLMTTNAFAGDDYDEVVPPYPVPAGELRLDTLNQVVLTKQTVFTTYIESNKLGGVGSLYGMSISNAEVPCTLSANGVSLQDFNEVGREQVGGGTGLRFYASPKSAINLRMTMSSGRVEEVKGACNGEPELCQPSHYEYRTTITLADENNTQYSLSCLANFRRPLFASDVKINGVQIK